MSYFKNGKKISREELFQDAKGFDFNKGFIGEISGFTSFFSPIDGKRISNTADLEAHNRFHEVQQVGHEYQEKLNNLKHKVNYD